MLESGHACEPNRGSAPDPPNRGPPDPRVRAAAALAACALGLAPVTGTASAASAVDGQRAYRDLTDLVREPAETRAGLIGSRLRQAGFAAVQESRDTGLANVIGERLGPGDELVIVATHYDARGAPAANEAASGPAVLLEAARALAGEPLARTLWLVFFDGHERELRGSRALAARLEREGRLARVRALIVVERAGDTDLRLETSRLASPRLRALAFAAAPELVEPRALAHFDGDHLPFLRKGLREVLPLADLRYGPGDPPGAWTGTPADDPHHVSAASLARATELVRRLALELATTRSRPASPDASPRR